MNTWYKIIGGYYRYTAILFFHVAILFLLINAVAYAMLSWRTSRTDNAPPPYLKYGYETLSRAYPGFSEAEIRNLLHESWTRFFIYDEVTQFRERSFQGKFVNVSPHGFRILPAQGPWPPDTANLNVFLFGGSTAFGYGLPDRSTVAVYLQAEFPNHPGKKTCVYNFAGGNYFSVQERLLFEKLILQGHIPDIALFIDGLNEFTFYDRFAFTGRLTEMMERGCAPIGGWSWVVDIPVVKILFSLRKKMAPPGQAPAADGPVLDIRRDNASGCDTLVKPVIRRYLANMEITRAIAARHGVVPIFVWQPVPVYRYGMEHHLFGSYDWSYKVACAASGYEYLKTQPTALEDAHFIWCADMQESVHENLYVDGVHYNAKMCKMIARAIADSITSRKLWHPQFHKRMIVR